MKGDPPEKTKKKTQFERTISEKKMYKSVSPFTFK